MYQVGEGPFAAMKIDLHIHSKSCSDGKWSLPEIIQAAHERGLNLISITDHDSIECQESAEALTERSGMRYITGLELNISFSHPRYRDSKPVPLDVLAYDYDPFNSALDQKIIDLRQFRKSRAEKILEKINQELTKKRYAPLTHTDLEEIEATVDGAFGRPHIANHLVKKGLVSSRQEAFDSYLVKCDVPKMPVSLKEASELIRGAGGKIILAHPNDPNGTSLASLTPSLLEQLEIIRNMLPYLDGLECWHSRHDRETVLTYTKFAAEEGLMVTGGSDCHQQPVIMGTVSVPAFVAEQFHPDA